MDVNVVNRVPHYLARRALAIPCGGPGACRLTRSSVERCFLRHISAAGFRAKRAGVKTRGLAGHVSGDA